MVVQQHVLNWLYSVLTSEYHDVNRTYSNVAQALNQYPTLAPRTDVHTFPNGTSALLLHLSGTIPVLFRGTTYRFPVSIWIPHAYPREAPIVYVTPTETMMVRPGQHVDPQGQVYHPYLAGWPTFWDKSSLLDFLAILRDIFAKEPPVIARQANRPPPPAQQHTPTPPPIPPLPPDLAPRPASQVQTPSPANENRPPPPPPKPGQEAHVSPRMSQNGPPLPPLPPGVAGAPTQYGAGPSQGPPPQVQPGPSRYDSAPPLPGQSPPRQRTFPLAGPPANGHALPPTGAPPVQPPFPVDPRRMSMPPQPSYGPPPPPWAQAPPPQPKTKPPPPPDLMDKDDLTLSLPSQPISAPPIPPNPEKDHLLRQLASTLHTYRQQSRSQNESSLQGLQAQRTAMLSVLPRMQADLSALTHLSALLQSNTAILQDSLRRADGVVANAARHPAPKVDDLLVASTVVGNQLYDLVAEERALADAVFVLGRAVERGRIAPQMFAKMVRGLSREWFLKKSLVRKCGRGMGLAQGGQGRM